MTYRQLFFAKTFVVFLPAFFFIQIIFSNQVTAQLKCVGPKYCLAISSGKTINVFCNSIEGAYAYRARIKSPNDSMWQYFMVNAPDTVIQIPKLKSNFVFIIQMGIMCSSQLEDSSDFSNPDTLYTNCLCELPNNISLIACDSTTATISWSPTLDAKKFKLFYTQDAKEIKNWVSVIVEASATPIYTLKDLNPGTDYVFSLRSICEKADRGISPLFTPYLKFKTNK